MTLFLYLICFKTWVNLRHRGVSVAPKTLLLPFFVFPAPLIAAEKEENASFVGRPKKGSKASNTAFPSQRGRGKSEEIFKLAKRLSGFTLKISCAAAGHSDVFGKVWECRLSNSHFIFEEDRGNKEDIIREIRRTVDPQDFRTKLLDFSPLCGCLVSLPAVLVLSLLLLSCPINALTFQP